MFLRIGEFAVFKKTIFVKIRKFYTILGLVIFTARQAFTREKVRSVQHFEKALIES